MHELTTLEQACEISAIRLVHKRQNAKVGDIFRLSPSDGIFLWGRLVKKANFFGLNKAFNLVYIYDVVSQELPNPDQLTPENLLIGPTVVNNLGWLRGYWEIIEHRPIYREDLLNEHFFIRFRGVGGGNNYEIVDERGTVIKQPDMGKQKIAQSGFSNFNAIDWEIRDILECRGII
jgi:hypothetical protein